MKKSSANKIRVLIVDDQLLFRQGIEGLLSSKSSQFVIVGSVGDGKKAVEFCKKNKVDIVLMDIEMPVMDGIEATQKIRSADPNPKILILSMHYEEEIIIHLIEKGANGFLSKNEDIEHLIDAIHSIHHNGYFFNDRISKAMVAGLLSKMTVGKEITSLTDREIEIIELIAKEYTGREIAEKLNVSERTIDNYRNRILEKTGAKNTVGIVMYAIKNKLIDLKMV